jgi:CcmD family protein
MTMIRFRTLAVALAAVLACSTLPARPAVAQDAPAATAQQGPAADAPASPEGTQKLARTATLPERQAPPRTLRAYAHVFIAFALAWLLLFGYLVSLVRRFGRLERELEVREAGAAS